MAMLARPARHRSATPPASRPHPHGAPLRRVPSARDRSRAQRCRRGSRYDSRATWRRARCARRDADTFAAIVRASLGPTMADRFYAPVRREALRRSARPSSRASWRGGASAPSSAAALVRRVVRPNPDRGIFFYPRRGYGQISEAIAAARHAKRAPTSAPAPKSPHLRAPGDRVEIDTARRLDDHAPRLRGRRCRSPSSPGWRAHPGSVRRRQPTRDPRDGPRVPRAPDGAVDAVRRALLPGARRARSAASRSRRTTATAPKIRATSPCCAPRSPARSATTRWTAASDALAGAGARRARRAATSRRRHRSTSSSAGCRARTPSTASATSSRSRRSTRGPPRCHASSTSVARGLFAHDNTHHALAMAWAAADAIRADGLVDEPHWARARADFATHVVED